MNADIVTALVWGAFAGMILEKIVQAVTRRVFK